MCQNLCRGVTNFVDGRTESEYSFGKLLTSAHSLSAKCFGIEENMYNLSKEESDRIRIIKFIAIILVVYFHSYTTGVYFSDGTNTLYLPGWLQVIEKGVSQVIAGCNVQIFFLLSAILLFRSEQRYGTVLKKRSGHCFCHILYGIHSGWRYLLSCRVCHLQQFTFLETIRLSCKALPKNGWDFME